MFTILEKQQLSGDVFICLLYEDTCFRNCCNRKADQFIIVQIDNEFGRKKYKATRLSLQEIEILIFRASLNLMLKKQNGRLYTKN